MLTIFSFEVWGYKFCLLGCCGRAEAGEVGKPGSKMGRSVSHWNGTGVDSPGTGGFYCHNNNSTAPVILVD